MNAGADIEGFLSALHQYLVYCTHVGVYWETHPIIFKLVSLLPSKGQAWMFNFVIQQVTFRYKKTPEEKLMAHSDYKDFLSRVLELQSTKDDFTMEDTIAACLNNIGAGSDTTSINLTSIFYNLISSPDRFRRVSPFIFK